MNRLLFTLQVLLVGTLCGCTPPFRVAADGGTLIPLKWPPGLLPKEEGMLQRGSDGPICFDSIYTCPGSIDGTVGYLRFWKAGHVLGRGKAGPEGSSHPAPVTTQDADVDDEWLKGPPSNWVENIGLVGRYYLVGNEIHIVWFGFRPDGTGFFEKKGRLTPDGFVLTDRRVARTLSDTFLFWTFWTPLPQPQTYRRQQMGNLRGQPTW